MSHARGKHYFYVVVLCSSRECSSASAENLWPRSWIEALFLFRVPEPLQIGREKMPRCHEQFGVLDAIQWADSSWYRPIYTIYIQGIHWLEFLWDIWLTIWLGAYHELSVIRWLPTNELPG